jgi:hypothetical protein
VTDQVGLPKQSRPARPASEGTAVLVAVPTPEIVNVPEPSQLESLLGLAVAARLGAIAADFTVRRRFRHDQERRDEQYRHETEQREEQFRVDPTGSIPSRRLRRAVRDYARPLLPPPRSDVPVSSGRGGGGGGGGACGLDTDPRIHAIVEFSASGH